MDVGSIKNSPGMGSVQAGHATAADAAREQSTVSQLTTSARPAPDQERVTRDQVESAVSTIQDFVQSIRRDINFSLDDGSGRVVVKVTDASSGEVIRQIPSEEALQLAESLAEMRSLLFKAEA